MDHAYILEQITKLKDKESYVWPDGDSAKAEIWFNGGYYILFETKLLSDELIYIKSYRENELDDLIKLVNSWT